MSERMDISESELHAYVDGALDADRARAVARSLADDPALANRVAAFRADMAMLNCLVAITRRLSVSCTVKVDVPAVPGVPVMAPVAERVKPAGRAPVEISHEYGGVPPVAASACE